MKRNLSKLRARPKSRTFYYRNRHGKVVALSEEVAAEQHNKHEKYLGNSDDLKRAGFDQMKLLGKFLEKNEDKIRKEPPQDQRGIKKTKNGTYVKGSGEGIREKNPQQTNIDKIIEKKVEERLKQVQNGQQNKSKTSKD